MKIEIQDITRLSVKPGEVLLVRLPEDWSLTPEGAARISQTFKEALPGVKVLIAPAEVAVEVVADEAGGPG